MREFEITNLYSVLRASKFDASVGIAIAALSGSDAFRLYATELPPATKVAAHLHRDGEEIYLILSGEATIYTGTKSGSKVVWRQPRQVRSGDSFTIPPATVHQLHNTGGEPLILIFGCPSSHLGSDRAVVADYPISSLDLQGNATSYDTSAQSRGGRVIPDHCDSGVGYPHW